MALQAEAEVGPTTDVDLGDLPAPRRRRRSRAAARAASPPDGKIGEAIYEEVNALIKREGLTKTEAFERVGQAQGRQAGTVSANYYRVARSQGVTRKPRPARGQSVERTMKAAQDAIAALSRLAREQDREIARLREEHESFAELRRLVGRPTRQRRRRS